MKDYFKPEYHEHRAAQEDHARRLTAALIEYVESPHTNTDQIAEDYAISPATLSTNAQKYIREEYLRKRGPAPNPDRMSERAVQIANLLRKGWKATEIAGTLGCSRQYVYDVASRMKKAEA